MIQSLKRLPRARLHHQPDKTRHNQIVCTQTPAFRFAGPFHLGVSFLGGFLVGAGCQRETKGHSPMFEVPPPQKKSICLAREGEPIESWLLHAVDCQARNAQRVSLVVPMYTSGLLSFCLRLSLEGQYAHKGASAVYLWAAGLGKWCVCVHIVWVHHCWLICSEGKETIKGVLSC